MSPIARAGTHKSEEEWQVALDRAASIYPQIRDLDWSRLFADDFNVVGRILGDILKLQKAEENPHRRGRRTVPQVSTDKLWELFEGFATEPFPVVMKKLMEKKSLRQVAIRCNMSHMSLYRFLNGDAIPSMEMMENIAQAFNKPAWYFAEYRAQLIGNLVRESLMQRPTDSIDLMKRALNSGRT